MFDPELLLDNRLAAECGVKNPELFVPVPSGSENEIKALAGKHTDFLLTRDAIQAKSNRVIDYRTFYIKPKPLITLNLDTIDQRTGLATMRLRNAGFSGRLRFEVDPDEDLDNIDKIDFSFKTMYGGTYGALRGEWEAKLDSLTPDFDALVKQTKDCVIPLPKFFRHNNIKPDELRVVSIGCCWRREYNHYHVLPNQPGIIVYSQTEDSTVFTTPHADHFNAMIDKETEAETKGIWDIDPGQLNIDAFNNIQLASSERTQRLILAASPTLTLNTVSKAERGRIAIERAYQDFCDPTLSAGFNNQNLTPEMFSVMQNVRPDEVSLKNIGFILKKIAHESTVQIGDQKDMKDKGFHYS